MSAVLAFTRLDIRRRWMSLGVLVLLVALASGVVLTTLAGARRTDTVLSRLNAKVLPADAMVLPNQQGFDWSKVRSLPSVKTLGTFALEEVDPRPIGSIAKNFDEAASFPPADKQQNVVVDRPDILSGRAANPNNPNEIVVSPGFVAKYGKTITLQYPSRSQVKAASSGATVSPAKYDGTLIHLHVVGVALNTFELGGGPPSFVTTYAYFKDYIKPFIPYFANARVILKDGEAGIPEFQKELAAATGNPNIQVDDWHNDLRTAQRAASFTAVGWVLFAGIAFLASLVLIGQAFIRFSAGNTDDLRTLAALGMNPRQARVAAAIGPAIAAVVGVALAVVGSTLASRLFPTGGIQTFEPDPGVRIDGLVLGGGAIVVLAIALAGAWWAGRGAVGMRHEPPNRPSVIATAARRLPLGVTTLLGTRFALEPGRGKTRVPVRPALVGAVAGVLGVVGALTFRTGLDHTVDNPLRFGQTMTEMGFVSEGGPPPGFAAALAQAAKDPDLAVLDDMRVASLSINGRTTSATSITPEVGHVPIVSLSGRPPTTASEIALGPETAKDLGVSVGSTVTAAGHAMTVTGISFVPQNPHNDYTDGAWLTTAGFSKVLPDEHKDKFHEVRFNFKPGVDVAAALKRLPPHLAPGGIGPAAQAFPIQQQQELVSLRPQPLLLGGFLIVLAIGAVGHGLATAVRRRRHDVAVLRALGLTRWQTRLIVVTQATVLAAVGLVIGIPLGVAAGRTGWRILAHATPVYYVPPLALLALLLAIPVSVVAANLLAALPARRAVRMRVSDILRTE